MMNSNYQIKRKTVNEKEIMDFFTMLEDKFENNSDKLQSIVEVFNKYNNSNEEDVLIRMRDILSEYPILILELNKMLPKSNRLPLVDQENADNFLVKIKERDEYAFKEIMKSLFSYKKGEIPQEKLISRFEELLMKHSDLLEEAYLFLDYKRISNAAYKKNLMTKLSQNRVDLRRNQGEAKGQYFKVKDFMTTPTKIQSNPEFVFFEYLKTQFDPPIFKSIIKLLYLFNEGVINHAEFLDLTLPFFTNQDLYEYLKTLTYSKMMNRRQFSLINKPLAELDLSKSQRICTSYSELPNEYPRLICSGRSENLFKLLNDRLISIPAGSEDDKNPLKKNHYEEHIFKFEDQRYEIDMVIGILSFAVDELNTLNEKVTEQNLENIELEQFLRSSTIRFISYFYKDYSTQVLQGIKVHPIEAIPIVINRFKKRMDEELNKKSELEKNIKLSFDRFYYKSFDHRSFKLKNFEKKSNNAKAFIKEITTRKKEKMLTHNLNILKGGSEIFEFYFSINFKLSKDNINRIIKASNDEILLKNFELNSIDVCYRKKLPEMKIIIDNVEILKIAVTLIFYQLHYSNINDSQKVLEVLTNIFENLFGINVSQLVSVLYGPNSPVGKDKENSYTEVIESIKNKNVEQKNLDKYYNIDTLASNIVEIDPSLKIINENSFLQKDATPDNHSEISLTPSLQSQDTGKTYKDLIVLEEEISNLEKSIKNVEKLMFFPEKSKTHTLFYANENCFVLVRFIFCIYERINKLYEYSISVSSDSGNYNSRSTPNHSNEQNLEESTIFKNFIIIYKALIHKKIENISLYEELCRDILGNESYFLFNLDKLINSMIKTLTLINNDSLSKEIINLFLTEKSRKNTVCESLYLSNFMKLFDGSTTSTYRLLYSPSIKAMTIHLIDAFADNNRKDYLETFKEFLDNTLQESYQKLEEENQTQDDPFNVFLERNKTLVHNKRNCMLPIVSENNLLFKFDFASKKLNFFKSGVDVLAFPKDKFSKIEKLKRVVKNNIKFKLWSESKVSSYLHGK